MPVRGQTVEATDRPAQTIGLQVRIQFLGEGTQGCPREMATGIKARATLAADPNHRHQHVRFVAVGVRAGSALWGVISHRSHSCHPAGPHTHPSISADPRSSGRSDRLSCHTWPPRRRVASTSWRGCYWCRCHRGGRHTALEIEKANGNWANGLRPTPTLEAGSQTALAIES